MMSNSLDLLDPAMRNREDSAPVTIITANPDGKSYWMELWVSRELLFMMVWRDIVVRYKQTIMGVTWALIRPLATMMVFTLVFGKLANLPSHGAPYALMVFAGLLPWLFFTAAFSDVSNSIVGNGNLVSKIYFPRLIIPLSSLIVGVIDFLLALAIYILLSIFYGHTPGLNIFALPIFLLQLCFLILGCGLWVASLSVWYRDFRFLLPVVLQLGAYLSPVGFSSAIVPIKWEYIYALNPMVGIIDGFRWALLGDQQPLRWTVILISLIITFMILIPGLRFFRKNEHHFSDAI